MYMGWGCGRGANVHGVGVREGVLMYMGVGVREGVLMYMGWECRGANVHGGGVGVMG